MGGVSSARGAANLLSGMKRSGSNSEKMRWVLRIVLVVESEVAQTGQKAAGTARSARTELRLKMRFKCGSK
jgi:hypothetical protein